MMKPSELGAFISKLPDEVEVLVVTRAGRLNNLLVSDALLEPADPSMAPSWPRAIYAGLKESFGEAVQ